MDKVNDTKLPISSLLHVLSSLSQAERLVVLLYLLQTERQQRLTNQQRTQVNDILSALQSCGVTPLRLAAASRLSGELRRHAS